MDHLQPSSATADSPYVVGITGTLCYGSHLITILATILRGNEDFTTESQSHQDHDECCNNSNNKSNNSNSNNNTYNDTHNKIIIHSIIVMTISHTRIIA